MNEIGPEQLLSQIRALNRNLDIARPADVASPDSFGNLLKNTLDNVNEAQGVSRDMKRAFTAGTSDASLAEVMIASEKASISFRAVTEVRNKVVQAYQDIMNMPV